MPYARRLPSSFCYREVRARCAWGILAASIFGCGPLPRSREAGAVGTLVVRPVAWNPTLAPVGKVRAVAESGDVVCVLSEEGATVFLSKAVSSRDDRTGGFISGEVIRNTEGNAHWIVAIDGQGRLQRLRGSSTFEDVGALYGLDGKKVLGATVAGPDAVGFLLDHAVAIATSRGTASYPTSGFSRIAGGGGFIVGIGRDSLDRINVQNGYVTRFSVPGVTDAALDARGRLVAITRRAVYAANAAGDLHLIYDAGRDAIHGLTASGTRVWFGDGSQLGILDGDRISETNASPIDENARLSRADNGDVWVLADGKLARFAPLLDDAPNATAWSGAIAPVFARSCASCHQPNGVAGVDLSTESAWDRKRHAIRERVLVDKTMPPKDHALTDADRESIRAWLDGSSRR